MAPTIMYSSHAILVRRTPAIKPESDEAITVPSLNLYSLGSLETKSFVASFMLFYAANLLIMTTSNMVTTLALIIY